MCLKPILNADQNSSFHRKPEACDSSGSSPHRHCHDEVIAGLHVVCIAAAVIFFIRADAVEAIAFRGSLVTQWSIGKQIVRHLTQVLCPCEPVTRQLKA